MTREIELKEGQGIGLVEVDLTTGDIKVKPAIVSDLMGDGDKIMADLGGIGTGLHKNVQLPLPELEGEIINAVVRESKKAEEGRRKMND